MKRTIRLIALSLIALALLCTEWAVAGTFAAVWLLGELMFLEPVDPRVVEKPDCECRTCHGQEARRG